MSRDEALSVMVVDDEPGIRTALRANFLRHGWNVETASCVREAIRSVENREYDLVVTDMTMPDLSGVELAAWRKAGARGAADHSAWKRRLDGQDPARRKDFEDALAGRVPDGAVVVEIDHGAGVLTLYGHLEVGLAVAVGDRVVAGQVLGAVGMTGNTTGPHLHFGVWRAGVPVDPLTILPPRP